MKHTLLLIVPFLLLNMNFLHAQTELGGITLGVSSQMGDYGGGPSFMGFGVSKEYSKSDLYDESKDGENDIPVRTAFNLSPKIGFFVADNLSLGMGIDFGVNTLKSGDWKSSTTMLYIDPFTRYYIPLETVYPFIEVGVSAGQYVNKVDDDDVETEYKSVYSGMNAGLGAAFILWDVASIDLMIGYSHSVFKDLEDNEDNYRTIRNKVGLNVGFTFFLY